jgi:hypothetical protein
VEVEVVHHRVDPLDRGVDPTLDCAEEMTQFAVVRPPSAAVKASPVAGRKAPKT